MLNAIDNVLRFLVHNFFKTIGVLVFNLLFRTIYVNGHNVPKKGGCIVCPNHSSFWDPPLVGCVTYARQFRFMARNTLFNVPVWGTLLRYMGAFPVKRGTIDRKSWANLIQLVEDGEAVFLFPEGTRTLTGDIQEGKPGTGMLVYMSKAKVLPVYVHGAFESWPKGQKLPKFFKTLYVIYGELMDFTEDFKKEESKDTYVIITNKIIDRIKALKAELLEKYPRLKK